MPGLSHALMPAQESKRWSFGRLLLLPVIQKGLFWPQKSRKIGSKVFALYTTWSAVAGQSALVAGGCLLFEATTWLRSDRLGQTDQTVSLFQCPFCSCVLGIVFPVFWTFIILCFFAGMSTSNGRSTEGCGTGISASNATVTCGAPTAGLKTGGLPAPLPVVPPLPAPVQGDTPGSRKQRTSSLYVEPQLSTWLHMVTTRYTQP